MQHPCTAFGAGFYAGAEGPAAPLQLPAKNDEIDCESQIVEGLRMAVLFNNCSGRNHVELFGATAFYDLETSGRHSTQALNLPNGAECVVASYEPSGSVAFNWYELSAERRQTDPDRDVQVRVFHGKWMRKEVLPKGVAAQTGIYRAFFNRLGHFKQVSVAAESL
jgi:hypothetical protein